MIENPFTDAKMIEMRINVVLNAISSLEDRMINRVNAIEEKMYKMESRIKGRMNWVAVRITSKVCTIMGIILFLMACWHMFVTH